MRSSRALCFILLSLFVVTFYWHSFTWCAFLSFISFSFCSTSHFVVRSRLCTLRGCVTRWHNGDENVFDLDSSSYFFFFIFLLFHFIFRASWTHYRQLQYFRKFRLEMRCDNSQSVWQCECILKMINARDKIIFAWKTRVQLIAWNVDRIRFSLTLFITESPFCSPKISIWLMPL